MMMTGFPGPCITQHMKHAASSPASTVQLAYKNVHCVICEDPTAVAQEAATLLANVIRSSSSQKNTVLGLATVSTPQATYAKLVEMHRVHKLSFRNVTTFNLDEYWGLSGDHDQSYRFFMNDHLFSHVDVRLWNTHVLDGKTTNPRLECKAFETKILAAGGIDAWLLGIGVNGHVAFNEPGSTVDSRTRLVSLSPETIAVNSDGRFFKKESEVPRCALSCGIGTIREARRIVLLATGAKKAKAIAAALEGPFTVDCPASLLQDHPDCIFIIDKEAAQDLKQYKNL